MPTASLRESPLSPRGAQAPSNVIEMESGPLVLPLVADCVQVDRKVVEQGRVLITKKVEEHTEHVQVAPLWHEEVDVEHVPLGHFVEVAPSPHYEGETLVLPVVEEVVVVEKRLRLREEVRVTRRQVRTAAPAQDVTLRAEKLEVEHLAAAPEGAEKILSDSGPQRRPIPRHRYQTKFPRMNGSRAPAHHPSTDAAPDDEPPRPAPAVIRPSDKSFNQGSRSCPPTPSTRTPRTPPRTLPTSRSSSSDSTTSRTRPPSRTGWRGPSSSSASTASRRSRRRAPIASRARC